jgi:hypothetical protein
MINIYFTEQLLDEVNYILSESYIFFIKDGYSAVAGSFISIASFFE